MTPPCESAAHQENIKDGVSDDKLKSASVVVEGC